MLFHKDLYLVILGTFLYFTLVLNKSIISCNLQRELEGYKFPVYSTPFCPRNESEWNMRSAALNCNRTNGFTCLPNQQLTELLEFCYTQPRILIEAGTCLYLVKRVSKVNGYNCHHFRYGCHNVSFLSDRIFEYPGCISLGNGCFLAEPSCESGKFPYLQENGSIKVKQDSTIPYKTPQQSTEQIHTENLLTNLTNFKEADKIIAFFLSVFTPLCVIFMLGDCYAFDRIKSRICKKHGDVESSEVEKSAESKKQEEFIDNVSIDEGERNKSQEPKTSQAKRPRRGQTETREPTTDAKTIDTSIPCFSVSPETLLQHQESVSFPNMGVKRGNNATASASNNLPASPPVSDCHITIQPGDAGAASPSTGSLDGQRTDGDFSAAGITSLVSADVNIDTSFH